VHEGPDANADECCSGEEEDHHKTVEEAIADGAW